MRRGKKIKEVIFRLCSGSRENLIQQYAKVQKTIKIIIEQIIVKVIVIRFI